MSPSEEGRNRQSDAGVTDSSGECNNRAGIEDPEAPQSDSDSATSNRGADHTKPCGMNSSNSQN